VDPGASSDKLYELAYETSVRAIEDQASVLEGVQSRAGTLLAVAVVVTSFFGAQALQHAARAARRGPALHPISYTSGAMIAFGCTALLALVVLLPHDLRFSLKRRADARATRRERHGRCASVRRSRTSTPVAV
jgi:hypothetical protein